MPDLTTFPLEVREAADLENGRHVLEAVCVPWEATTRLTANGPELFARGAFSELLGSPGTWPKIRLTDSHVDTSVRRPVAKAVEFRDEPRGLVGRFQFFDTPEGRAAWENVREETYGGVSVGFIATTEGRRGTVREIRAARLHHVSLVDEPAYAEARVVSVRAAQDELAAMRAYFDSIRQG